MAVPWGLLIFVIGIVWGLVSPGRQGKIHMLWTGFLIGLVLGLAFTLLGYMSDSNPLALGSNFWDFVVGVFIMTLIFVLGVWLGDLIEGFSRSRRDVRRY